MSSNEEIDIDLNDPEVQKAALKIQHQFKGFKIAKKSVKVEKHEDDDDDDDDNQHLCHVISEYYII
ncbi:uncharacterized protein DC041_0011200 [Schistosoma bovis]|uniref:Uncharacterized protein n=2 Tax=Schistosoma TaxID=6181 RepID=A0A430PXX5_SCHBO|nr:uncharacterized protein DC041_0001006 [Schistosoma bovis]RTG89851.1 uncharacterized protein DC041_0011200 [Schistosoma bovis]